MSTSTIDLQERFRATSRAAIVGAVVNLVLSVIKILVGVLAQSQALIADGVHSVSDLLSDGLVYVAAHHARHGPDQEHPYGHGRIETAATMGLGLFLILVAGGIMFDGVESMLGFHPMLTPGVTALYAAAFSILVKEALYYYTIRIAHRIKSELLKANAWHHRTDSISSVVVVIGVGGSLLGMPYLDSVAAVFVGVMIAKIGWDLGWGAIQELVDAGLDEGRLQSIRDTILGVGGVRDIHMLRTRRIGGYASADVHVQVEPWLSVSEGHMIAVLVEHKLKQQIDEIDDVTVHVDPENDENSSSCKSLPARAQALKLLSTAWQGVEGADRRQRVVMHYLRGKIDLDVYFPFSEEDLAADGKRLREALIAALNPHPEFGRVQVYFQI